uniref:NADH-ubiquinone oxidoreductase chain 6 n=1 Tax=Indotyphlops braminus TaxID=51846 RepID=A9X4G3_9SAUR|nr:NADH dehydrogenase subunit 6 [Indotyphlops braminus]ABC55928.1 NADH dehydrogenase subunit 6 [Indotyphlops braminus]
MTYFSYALCFGFVVSVYGMCCSVVPYFGVVCVVLGAVFCCGLVAVHGSAFISLLLFIVYLGGMMVVFAYSVAMTEGFDGGFVKGQVFVLVNVGFCGLVGLGVVLSLLTGGFECGVLFVSEGFLESMVVDGVGVSLLYSVGVVSLVVSGWCLLLALFVVVEMVRSGFHGGGLRSV